MKRFMTFGAVLLLSAAFMFADEKTVSPESLPQVAKDFISVNFPGTEIVRVEEDWKDFEVMLADGTEIDFNKQGDWDMVKSRISVPASLLPMSASDYISESYPGTSIVEIDKDRNSYEVKLANNWELRFGRNGEFQRKDFDD